MQVMFRDERVVSLLKLPKFNRSYLLWLSLLFTVLLTWIFVFVGLILMNVNPFLSLALGLLGLGSSCLLVVVVYRLSRRLGKQMRDSRQAFRVLESKFEGVPSLVGTTVEQSLLKADQELRSRTAAMNKQETPNSSLNPIPSSQILTDDGSKSSGTTSAVMTPKLGLPTSTPLAKQLLKSFVRDSLVSDDKKRWIDSRTSASTQFPEFRDHGYREGPLPKSDEIPVVMIADDFTFGSFKDEFAVTRLSPTNWRDAFAKSEPAFFFCESAWIGGDSKTTPWRSRVYASVRWPEENRSELLQIIQYCRQNSIPTVFWNKEDPVHFPDRINDFVRTAALFDYVFTTAEECVPLYKRDAGVANADVLPFAVQPSIFNPFGSSEASNSLVFAGSWYNRYPERCEQGEKILDLAHSQGIGIEIYDRMYGSGSELHQYPQRFQEYIRPAISYEETALAYRGARFGMTLNTVTESPTMFARRAFELAASGSLVLSNYSVGVENFFGDAVIFADRDPDRLRSLDESEFQKIRRRALVIALENTYRQRAEKILKTLGIRFTPRIQAPTPMLFVSSTQNASLALNYAKSLDDAVTKQPVLVVEREADQTLVSSLSITYPRATILSERSLLQREFRQKSWLTSPSAIVLDPESPLTMAEIRYMTNSSEYSSSLITLGSDPSERFRFGLTTHRNNVLMPAESINKVIVDGEIKFPTVKV